VSTRFGECKGLSRCTTKWGRETCIL